MHAIGDEGTREALNLPVHLAGDGPFHLSFTIGLIQEYCCFCMNAAVCLSMIVD